MAEEATYGIADFIPPATRSRCTDAKVAYGYDGRNKVKRRCRLWQNLPQTGLSVFCPKTLPLPCHTQESIRQRKQATDGKSEDIKERLTDEAEI
ncbi:MAG: hypothetical protein ACI3ZY_00870 [Parabacteroides sp.]